MRYYLENPKDLDRFNCRMKDIGLYIQKGMVDGCYMACLNDLRFNKVITRNAGRRTVITQQLIYSVLQNRSEGMTIAEIAAKLHVSKGIVGQIIKDNTPDKSDIPEGQLSIYDFGL